MRGLPDTLPSQGLLVGWSLEAGHRKPTIGFIRPDHKTYAPSRTLEPILDAGEGHLLTVAPTGAGKGTGCIIPALLRYPGPVVVVDPKGENYAVTARRRREMGQEVILLDPFEVAPADERHRFNPLDLANPGSDRFIEDVSTLATLASSNIASDAMSRDPFWPQMGRVLVTAVLLDVLTMPDSSAATLPAARDLLNQPMGALGQRAVSWQNAEHPELRRMSGLLSNPADDTLGGYWALAVNQLDFIKGQKIGDHLSGSDLDLNKVHDGSPLSIYLVLPPDKLESHAALLRLWIGTLISVITRRSRRPDQSTLFLIDEAAQLGELPQLRQAITLLRGYGVRVWSFWQDLSQLRHRYPGDWETIINNCRVQQFFGAVTGMAADAVVGASGYGTREAVLDLARDEIILNVSGDLPVIARKPSYRFDPPFGGLFDDNPFYAGQLQDEDEADVQTRPVFRKSRAPSNAIERIKNREAPVLAQRAFRPVRARRWHTLEGDERIHCLRQARIENPAIHAEPKFVVRRCALPFYPNHDWYEIRDERNSPALSAYYVMGPENVYKMQGLSNVIYDMNRELGLVLNTENVASYLDFFCTSMYADEGRFLISGSADELEWLEDPDPTFLAELDSQITLPRVIAVEQYGQFTHWHIECEIVYGDSLFVAQFTVTPVNGDVEMVNDDALASDLPLLSDRSRLQHIGLFDSDGKFCAAEIY